MLIHGLEKPCCAVQNNGQIHSYEKILKQKILEKKLGDFWTFFAKFVAAQIKNLFAKTFKSEGIVSRTIFIFQVAFFQKSKNSNFLRIKNQQISGAVCSRKRPFLRSEIL